MSDVKFSDLVGKTLTEVRVAQPSAGDDEICFIADDGTAYKLYHSQDCCESVVIDDISGDLSDLIDTPILVAEERTSEAYDAEPLPDDVPVTASRGSESNTWTFYTLRTVKGTVDIRWWGNSNGYYSESVDFVQVVP